MTYGKGKGRGNIGFKGRGRGRNNFQREERKSRDPGRRIKPNLSSRGCNNNQASQRYGKSNVQCYYCKKYSHFYNECQKKKGVMSKQNTKFSKVIQGLYLLPVLKLRKVLVPFGF